MRILKVATCSLNQWAMDFDCNMKNIKESITRAKAAGAVIRLGPELEITGYGCEDHFFEQDTCTHAWECLLELLVGDWTDDILCSFGMPVVRGCERYDCQVLCMNRKILMIRPKMWLANGAGCSELRWFTAWKQTEPQLDDFLLPPVVGEAISQVTVPFGYGYLQFLDTAVAAEICKELFSAVQIHPQLALNGVEVFMNASGSIHQVQKMGRRLNAITSAMSARGGVYIYSNLLGCDGHRFYYDGCSCIVVNGELVAQGKQFTLTDVDMVVAEVDLDTVVGLRGSDSSFQEQASCKKKIPSIFVPVKLCTSLNLQKPLTPPPKEMIKFPSHEEEIAKGAACWLWNYLRRSGASGFVLPLSGGVDTSSVTAIVGCMCQLVGQEIGEGDEQVKADAIRIGNYSDEQFPKEFTEEFAKKFAKEFAQRVFCTVFMGSENDSLGCSKQSKALAEEIGSRHLDGSIDEVVSALLSLFQSLTTKSLPKKSNGRTKVALQNTEDRSRMVMTYMLASLLPWIDNKSGFYLVLSSTTADDGLCGNLTKYGCSSGDLNPVGSINRQDLRQFLKWAACAENLGYSSLSKVEDSQTNTTEERTISEEELSTFGRLRKISLRYGPLSMFENLCEKWRETVTPANVAKKVKQLFKMYAENRHKMTVLTPSYIVENHANEDNRFDHRQFLYNSDWPYQFRKIDKLLQQQIKDRGEAPTETVDSTVSSSEQRK